MSISARRSTEPHAGAAGELRARGFLRVMNKTRGTLLGNAIRLAQSSAERRRGLLGVDQLLDGEGLWIDPCEGVHTFGMRFPIDLVFVRRDCSVIKTVAMLQPGRISVCLRAKSIFELPAGTIERCRVIRGDIIQIIPNLTNHDA